MNNHSAFTFFELIFALFILVIILTPIIYLSGESRRGMSINAEDLFAHCAAYELTEQLFSIPFAELPSKIIPDEMIRDGLPIATGSHWLFCIGNVGSFSRRVEIFDFKKDGILRYKKIQVQIDWNISEGAGGQRSFTQTTLYANENL